jgi:FkbM family methyltransferase
MIRSLARALLRGLSHDQKFFLLREVANLLGVSSVTVNGPIGPIEGNLNDWTIFRRYLHGQAWETSTAALCVDYFKRYGKGTFVDVGANIGMIFIPVVQRSECFGVAIDASPINFSYLATNCRRNLPATSYKLSHVAVGNRSGKVCFDISGVNFGNHRVSDNGTTQVDLIRFDDLHDARDFPKPILIKLDIQGYEPEFLAGAPNLLMVCDALLLEYSPFGEKSHDWIEDYDRTILENFARIVRYDTMGNRELPPESAFLEASQSVLDEIKRSISMRKWNDPKEGHENILLLAH